VGIDQAETTRLIEYSPVSVAPLQSVWLSITAQQQSQNHLAVYEGNLVVVHLTQPHPEQFVFVKQVADNLPQSIDLGLQRLDSFLRCVWPLLV
jgi:hypothetical protein